MDAAFCLYPAFISVRTLEGNGYSPDAAAQPKTVGPVFGSLPATQAKKNKEENLKRMAELFQKKRRVGKKSYACVVLSAGPQEQTSTAEQYSQYRQELRMS